jgi:hypothetical protein
MAKMNKLKKGDTVMMQHETPEGGMLLECTVVKVKGNNIFFQIQIPFGESFIFKVKEHEIMLTPQ